jgi:hypothetical protein
MIRKVTWGVHNETLGHEYHDSPEDFRIHLGRYTVSFLAHILLTKMLYLRPLHRNDQAEHHVS